MTGPHRFDGVSHPPKVAQDSTRKAAPVDTVRLKTDLNDDVATMKLGLKMQADDMERGAGAEHWTHFIGQYGISAKARSDTLNKARAGKIPAKRSK
jgi:hypothetical protein